VHFPTSPWEDVFAYICSVRNTIPMRELRPNTLRQRSFTEVFNVLSFILFVAILLLSSWRYFETGMNFHLLDISGSKFRILGALLEKKYFI
jgi:hypothetical protein